MTHSFKPFFLLLGAVVLFSSCSDKTKINAEQATINLVASEKPAMVMSISAGEILEKSGMADGSVFPMSVRLLFGEMLSYATESEKTGIDLSGNSYIMATAGPEGEMNRLTMVYTLSDDEKFSKMIETDLEVKPAEKGKYKYVISPDNAMSFSWYKSFGICIINPAEENSKENMEKMIDEIMNKSLEKAEIPSEYSSFFASEADFSMMVAADRALKMAKGTMTYDMAANDIDQENFDRLSEYYKDSYTLYTASFETDKITASIENTFNEKAKKEISALTRKGIAPDMLNYLTNDKMLGYFTASVSAESMFAFMKESGGNDINRSIDEFKAETGISLGDIIASFSGDMTMSMAGMKERTLSSTWVDEDGKEQVEEWTSTVPVVNMCFGIKNNLIQTIADTTEDVKKEGNIYRFDDELFVVFLDNKMFVSTEEANAKQVAESGSLKPYSSGGNEKSALENAASGYFDFKALVETLDPNQKEMMQFLAPFDYASGHGDWEKMVFELNFRKSGKNGLYILTKSVMDTFFNFTF